MKSKATLHVKLDPEEDRRLSALARERGKSKGQLVREALQASYQTSFDLLPSQQRDALSAYKRGYISLGKVSEVFGLSLPEMQDWLRERGELEPAGLSRNDPDHAL